MNEIVRIVNGLRAERPSINLEQLLALESPAAEFEAHVSADAGQDFWIYTIDGKLLDGEAMVVRAPKFMADIAETRAQGGLRATIEAAKAFDVNTGLQATVEVRGME